MMEDVKPLLQTTPPGDKEEEPEAPTQVPTEDLLDAIVTDADRKLMGACGDFIHQSDRTHPDRGISRMMLHGRHAGDS